MTVVRAKFRCNRDERTLSGDGEQHKYTFTPVYEADRPEDERFAKYTPCGELWIQVTNPAVVFEIGQDYYLDFTPVPAPEQ